MRPNGSPVSRKFFGMRRDLIRGDSLFALLVCVVVSVFLINLVVSVINSRHFQKEIEESAGLQSLKALGHTLSSTAEALLGANEPSTLRRVVSEAGLENNLTRCSVTLPGGEIVADSDPGRISVFTVPATWEGQGSDYSEVVTNNTIILSFPLKIPGRGNATLSLSSSMMAKARHAKANLGLNAPTTQLALACLALAIILLVYRNGRCRLKAIGAIHEALVTVGEGRSDIASLELNPQLGSEAVVWNQLLSERKENQVRVAMERIQVSVQQHSTVCNEFETVCDGFAQGVLLVASSLKVKYVNKTAAVLLQVEPGHVCGRDISNCVTDAELLVLIQRAFQNQIFQWTAVEAFVGDSEEGTLLRYAVRLIHPKEGTELVLVTIEDVTQQKVVEASRSGFLAHAAHELRTPLTTVHLYVEKALEDCQSNPTRTARSLSVINSETKRLEKIVQEILSIAEIEAGSFSLKRDDVKLDVLFKQLKEEYGTLAQEKSIQLSFDIPPKLPMLHADREKIGLAFHNLISNAIKYTAKNGQVKVQVVVEDQGIGVRVSDTGIGIKAQDMEHIFDKFYRAKDERLANITGSGLGLPIARELVRLHGGDIVVESEFDQGSVFTLTLPVSQEVCVGGD